MKASPVNASLQDPERREVLVRELARGACDSNVMAIERIEPLLNLCRIYWDTDILLFQAGANRPQQQDIHKFLSTLDELSAVQLAIGVRSILQNELKVQRKGKVDPLKTRLHVLFRLGLSLECTSDTCKCIFHPRLFEHIMAMVSAISLETSSY